MLNLSAIDSQAYSIPNKYFFRVTTYDLITKVLMTCNGAAVNTDQLPELPDNLNKSFPSVLSTKCYNDDNLPFALEVKKTEIAHLFEHILIEYIYQLKLQQGLRRAKVRGITEWNWKREPYGTFNLQISVGIQDAVIFHAAFAKTLLLFDDLTNSLTAKERQTTNYQPSVFLQRV